MRFLFVFLIISAQVVSSFGQAAHVYQKKNDHYRNRSTARVKQEGQQFADFRQITANAVDRSIVLPPVVDNSVHPYMRSIFSQQGACCGQSASVGYNFTYEINRLRHLPSDTIINTYPDHFTWNFMNGTYPYYGDGVSYFHTFDILYAAGNPTEAVYGPIELDDQYFWMSGYEKYLSAMSNRISGAASIHVGTPEGLEILKHWLHNHLEGSEVGGVANFYAGVEFESHLPPGSPEAGKQVIVSWRDIASHAMTIVGYNDSIRFDRNADGQFTNHLDINNDGVVNMQDWEIGGLIFANSYGPNWGNDGYCYMMYSSLALPYGFGGIWNNSVHVIYPDTSYQPKLTLKARIKHNKRHRLKLSAGISADTSIYYPSQIIDFPIFNFQGGDFNMTGNPLAAGKTLELGLDITSLISYFKPGSPARIFLVVDEKDPDNKGDGEILDFAVYCHGENGEVTLFESGDSPTGITNNMRTLVSAVVDMCGNPPRLLVDDTVNVTPGQVSALQASVDGGQAPFQWKVKQVYYASDSLSTYPEPQGESLEPTNSTNGHVAVALPFAFPFFGKLYDTVYMHTDGYLMFSRTDMPYTYLLYEDYYLRSIEAISPLMHSDLGMFKLSDYMKADKDASRVRFYWKVSKYSGTGSVMFATELTPDGGIKFLYGENTLPGFEGIAGISPGDEREYLKSSRSQWFPANGEIRSFMPALPYGVAALAGDGQISLNPPANFTSGEFLLSIEDAGRLKDERKITLNSGIVIETTLKSGKKVLLPGQQEPLLVKITNHSSAGLSGGKLELKPASVNVVIQGDEISNIDIPAGESRIFDSMFTLLAPDTAGVAQDMLIKTLFTTGQITHTDRSNFRLAVPGITVNPPVIIDNNNGIAEPGEEVILSFNIINTGEVDAGEIDCVVNVNSPFAAINSFMPLNLGYLKTQGQINARVKLKLNNSAPNGRLINIEIIANSESAGQFIGSFPITIGKPGILVIDKDKNQNSAVHIAAAINQLNISCDRTTDIDTLIYQYSTIFLSLGFVNNHYLLKAAEDTLLTSFLDNGGKLYLESGTFFKQAPTTMLKGKMRTSGLSQAWAKPADTLIGFQGTAVEEFNIDYRGDYVRGDNLVPLEPSQPWFYDKNSELIFLSVLDSVRYKTIAAAFEFGGTFPFNGPDRKALMLEYLKFMEYPVDPFSVSFTPDRKVVCDKTEVTFTAIASQQPQSWQWSFPGGTPETWDGPSPGVKYETAGTYSVSLTVSNGEEQNTFTLEDAIRVESCIGLEEPETHTFRVYPNPASDRVTIEAQGIISNTLISISDMQGRVLVSQSFKEPAMRFDVKLGNASAGVYLVTVKSDKITKTTKLIVR